HDAEDVVVAGRGLVPLDLGVGIHERDGPGLVVEAASHAEAAGTADARRAADGLVVGDLRADEVKDRGAGNGDRVAVEDAAAESVPPVAAQAPGPARGPVATDGAVDEREGGGLSALEPAVEGAAAEGGAAVAAA